MDFEKRAKAELLKQIQNNGGTLTFRTGTTHPVTRRYLNQMVESGQLLEVEWSPKEITYRLPEYEQQKAA